MMFRFLNRTRQTDRGISLVILSGEGVRFPEDPGPFSCGRRGPDLCAQILR